MKRQKEKPSLRSRLGARMKKLLCTIKGNIPENLLHELFKSPLHWDVTLNGPSAGIKVKHTTPAVALKNVQEEASNIVEATAQQIEVNISNLFEDIEGELLETSLLSDRWPWAKPQNHDDGLLIPCLKILTHTFPKGIDLHEVEPRSLPQEVAALDIADWAREELKIGNLWELSGRDIPLHNNGKEWACPGAGLALLYLAIQQRSQPIVAIDAGRYHHAFVESCRDNAAQKRDSFGKEKTLKLQTNQQNKICLVEKGKPIQLELALPLEEAPQAAILQGLRHTFKAEGLRNWAALLRLWSVEGGRQGRIRWTLEEHLSALGYSERSRKDPKVRMRIAQMVESLARMELIILGADHRERYRAPLIHLEQAREVQAENGGWRVEGMILKANEYLYRGVRNNKTGRLGSNYWPSRPEIAQIDHVRHPYATGMGLDLSIRWRWAMNSGKEYVSLKGENLVKLAGASTNRHNATRTFEKLEQNLLVLQQKGILGKWEWNGSPGMDSVIKLWPSDWSAGLASGKRRLFEMRSRPDVPLTGAGLKEWREARKITQQGLAEKLGIASRTIGRYEQQNKKLSRGMISSLRKIM